MPPAYYAHLFLTFAFVLGASIGSFLNVCIYRMPRDLSVNEPRRSFCPKCKYQIPFWHNIPLVSWLALRGKCANCSVGISFRYFGVELLTGLLFLGVWWKLWPHAWVLALPYWILASLLVVATFIDFEFFIIPDEITWGGVVAGVVLSLAIPALMGTDSNLIAAGWSLAGAAFGYLLLWGVVELGKKLFGKKRVVFEKAGSVTAGAVSRTGELFDGGVGAVSVTSSMAVSEAALNAVDLPIKNGRPAKPVVWSHALYAMVVGPVNVPFGTNRRSSSGASNSGLSWRAPWLAGQKFCWLMNQPAILTIRLAEK